MDSRYYTVLHHAQQQHWWYAARRKILASVIESIARDGLPEGKIYDLGCGVGANLDVLGRFGEVVGVDGSPEAVRFCHERGYTSVRQEDLDALSGIQDGAAKLVVLADVIEHLDDEGPCLAAAHRLLARGGALLVTVPAYEWLWSPADDLNHHRRRYTAGQLERVIARRFRVERVTYFNTLLFGTVLAGRAVEKVLGRGGDDAAHVPPAAVNRTLETIFAAEAGLLSRVRLPFGVSILCVARKD